MRTWKITTRFRDGEGPDECRGVDQEQHVTGALPDEAAVRAYVATNWPHLEFRSAADVTPPPPEVILVDPPELPSPAADPVRAAAVAVLPSLVSPLR